MITPFRLPWSGDVTQSINPWTSWFSGNNSSLFQVNYASSAPQVEEKIIREVAGYGRQLGRIMDALEAVCALPVVRDKLDAKGRECVAEFEVLAKDIRQAKEKMLRESLTSYEFRSLLSNIQGLEQTNPELYEKLKTDIKESLFKKEEKRAKAS